MAYCDVNGLVALLMIKWRIIKMQCIIFYYLFYCFYYSLLLTVGIVGLE